MRHLKALCLQELDRVDEAVKLWTELSEDNPGFAPTLLDLAQYTAASRDNGAHRAIQMYERYAAAVPDDPRPHQAMADLYDDEGDFGRAESEYRARVERDPLNPDCYDDLARVLSVQHRYAEAVAFLDKAPKDGSEGQDMFASLLRELGRATRGDIAEELAATQPERMARSVAANLSLAHIRVAADRQREALPLLKKALQLDPKSVDAYDEMAVAYRKMQDWRAALAAADAALKISDEDMDAHFSRACALARMGRLNEALTALKRSIELDEDDALDFASEEDLKPLARLPAFKKLVSDREKNNKDN
jgi:tetratricopeptide (TPR) repeat protein